MLPEQAGQLDEDATGELLHSMAVARQVGHAGTHPLQVVVLTTACCAWDRSRWPGRRRRRRTSAGRATSRPHQRGWRDDLDPRRAPKSAGPPPPAPRRAPRCRYVLRARQVTSQKNPVGGRLVGAQLGMFLGEKTIRAARNAQHLGHLLGPWPGPWPWPDDHVDTAHARACPAWFPRPPRFIEPSGASASASLGTSTCPALPAHEARPLRAWTRS